MITGIAGLGMVGNANALGFGWLGGNTILKHDIIYDTQLSDLYEAEIIFLTLPTPSNEDGSCDTSIVESAINELNELNYPGVVVIRSTVPPGFTEGAIQRYPSLTICFSPEFLRERSAVDDFMYNQRVLVVGTDDFFVFEKVVQAHGHYPDTVKMLKPAEAEILKYFNNGFAALRVTFANIMYELCQKHGADYSAVKGTYIHTGKAKDLYLDVADDLRGYAGPCLPKDVKALSHALKEAGLDFSLIDSIDSDNEKFEKTVFKGMRK